jgi:hypothetical protein
MRKEMKRILWKAMKRLVLRKILNKRRIKDKGMHMLMMM